MKKNLTALLIFLFLNSCGNAEKKEINMAEVKTAITAGNAKYIQANEKGDAALFAGLFDNEGMIVHPNVDPIRGKEHIEAEVSRIMSKSRFSDWEMNSLSMYASGNLAYELIQYGFTLRPEGKNPIALSGKYLMIWKQQADGSWKILMQVAQPND
jgi:uncharacterized protein (TIGR02246 family)